MHQILILRENLVQLLSRDVFLSILLANDVKSSSLISQVGSFISPYSTGLLHKKQTKHNDLGGGGGGRGCC